MKTEQMEMVSVEQLVSEKHTYRRLKSLLDFKRIAKAVIAPLIKPCAILTVFLPSNRVVVLALRQQSYVLRLV